MRSETLAGYQLLQDLDGSPAVRLRLVVRPPDETRLVMYGGAVEALRSSVFLETVRRVRAIEHPGIARIVDSGEEEGTVYAVRQAVEGPSLGALSLAEHEAVELVAQVAECLVQVHAAGVVHGDVRPDNLIRGLDGRVQLTGFGPAPAVAAAGGRPGSWAPAPAYLSPEQVRGEAIDGRSDLFSLTVVLYELLVGRVPFAGESEASVVYRIVHEPAPTADARPALAELLARGLAKRPEDRFASAAEMAEALREVSVAMLVDARVGGGESLLGQAPAAGPPDGGHGSSGDLPPATRVSPRRGSPVPFVIGIVVLCLAAAAAWMWLRSSGSAPGNRPQAAAEVWLDASVRTEPPGLEVRMDGVPLDPADRGRLRFLAGADGPVLSAAQACRSVERVLDGSDAGREVVLVIDPPSMEWRVDPGVAGAEVVLNAESAGTTPTTLNLDLCRENEVVLRAGGHRDATVTIEAGALPLAARKLLFDLKLEVIPRGRLTLPKTSIQLVYYVDGKRQPAGRREVELDVGTHELRYKNDYHFMDRNVSVEIHEGDVVAPELGSLNLARLVVQAFPANCKVYLRRPGGSWRFLDETPAERQVVPGRYEVKVERDSGGQTRLVEVQLSAGENPPVRVALGAGS